MSDTVERARALFGPLRWEGAPVSEAGEFVLPIGTVTLLLGDVEGSTRNWEERPDEMPGALVRVNEVVDATVAAHQGVRPVEQGEGDSFVAAFSRASDAVACALAVQRDVPDSGLKLRLGVHTGEVQLRDEGNYVGPAINRAARLRDAAHGGQVVLSQVTAELVRDRLAPGTSLLDLGSHRLKDLGRPERVFQLAAANLADEFPPLRSLDHLPNNLPVQLTSFVGREPALAALRKLVTETRMLTLTGAGGCGKTRLALELAARVLEDYADGAWLVDLAPVADPKAVAAAVASGTRVREQQGRRLVDTLVDELRGRRLLLVLDNCEHLVEAAAELSAQLLLACPELTILATSREQLGVPGETAWRVPSLSVPEERRPGRVDSLSQYEAVQLFVERARKARPNFTVSNETAPAVAGICRRLDGIPLAVELAAARTRVLSADQILEGLDDCFRLLTGGARTVVARQQTLRASVDWSYRLLSGDERVVLARLSVFAGGFTLDAAEKVAGVAPIDPLAVLDLLQSLVDKSLVLVDDGAEMTRYRMLETIRQYAGEQLTASGEAAAARDRHCEVYVALAEAAEPHLEGRRQEEWGDRLEQERQNLRAAFDWAHTGADAVSALRLVAGLHWFWVIRARVGEGWRLCRLALELNGDAPPEVRVRAMVAACHVGWFRFEPATQPIAHDALELARECGDRRSEGRALYHTSWWGGLGNPDATWDDLMAAIAIAREVDDRWGLAIALTQAGTVLGGVGRIADARPFLEEALTVCDEIGDRYIGNTVRHHLGNGLVVLGQTELGERMLREALAHARSTGDTFSLTMTLADLGLCRASQGHYDEAIGLLEEDVGLFEAGRLPLPSNALQAYGVLGALLSAAGRYEEARPHSETAVAKAREAGPWAGNIPSLSLVTLARNEYALGDHEAARLHLDEALALLEDRGSWVAGDVLNHAAGLLFDFGDRDSAERHAHESLAANAELGNHYRMGGTISALETVALVSDDAAVAGRLLGAIDALLKAAGIVRPPAKRAAYDAGVARLREELGKEAWEQAYREGSGLSLEDAVAYARRGRGQRRRPSSGWESLTPAEVEVVKLVAEGLSNPEIAERLFVSRKTVTTHLTHVFAKLGMSSRTELGAEAARRGM